MKLRETFAASNIAEDLRHIAGTEQKMTKSAYTKVTIGAVAVGVPAGVLAVFFPLEALLATLILLVAVLAAIPAYFLWKKHKQKTVSMDDYEIIEDTLSHKEEEVHKETYRSAYRRRAILRRTVTVTVYFLHFENGKSLQIPRLNFTWSEEQSMSDASLYNEAHRGDGFYLVVHKESGKIAAAYPKSRFVYQER
jgi:hypothetical protein